MSVRPCNELLTMLLHSAFFFTELRPAAVVSLYPCKQAIFVVFGRSIFIALWYQGKELFKSLP